MPNYLTCEAEMDFPLPNVLRVVEHLIAVYDGQTPITTQSIANTYGLSANEIMIVLRRAQRIGMIGPVGAQGWVPLQT